MTGESGVGRRAFVGGAAVTALGMGIAAAAGPGAAHASEGATRAASPQVSGDAHAHAPQAPDIDDAWYDEVELASEADLSLVPGGNAWSPYIVPSVTTQDEKLADVRRVLVVVDYQVDFVDGVFGRIEPAAAIEDALYERVLEYQQAGEPVFYTMDTHPQDVYAYTREATYNPPHCVPGTEGWEVYGKVRELLTPERATLVKKGTYGSMDLPGAIRSLMRQGAAVSRIEVAGVSTTCRVLHNVIILYNAFPEVEIVLDATTTAAYSDEATVEQLKVLEGWGICVRW